MDYRRLCNIQGIGKGYKQRVGIAQAIIHEPKLLILDEPTSGLDPVQNLQIRNLIKDIEEKRTVILSTHILSEIEQIAHRVLSIKSGRIIVDESLETLLKTPHDTKDAQPTLEEVFIKMHNESNEKS